MVISGWFGHLISGLQWTIIYAITILFSIHLPCLVVRGSRCGGDQILQVKELRQVLDDAWTCRREVETSRADVGTSRDDLG